MIGKNQNDFAKFVGVSLRTLVDFEQGKGNPTISTIEKMLTGSGLVLTVGRKP
jgi:DNA-binding XRE family transcriptional regulator